MDELTLEVVQVKAERCDLSDKEDKESVIVSNLANKGEIVNSTDIEVTKTVTRLL